MAPTRRQLLRLGLLGGAALAVGGVGLGLQSTVPRAPAGPLRSLGPREYAVLSAIADRICPGGAGLPSATALGVPDQLDAFLVGLHPGDVADLGRLLLLIENALPGLLFDGRLVTFTAAAPEVQDRILEGWRTSGLRFRRMAFKALHNLCSGAYWANPAVYAATGYPGPPANLQAPAPVEPDPAAVPADPAAPAQPAAPTSGTL